jgi:TfoX/Sxy family transcriptional regulator of competence genes
MAYDEQLADRVREALGARDGVSERKMFGGITFMLGGHMCLGVVGEDLMVRLDPADADAALAEPHVRPMDFTGRPARGFLLVSPEGVRDPAALGRWVDDAANLAATRPPKG